MTSDERHHQPDARAGLPAERAEPGDALPAGDAGPGGGGAPDPGDRAMGDDRNDWDDWDDGAGDDADLDDVAVSAVVDGLASQAERARVAADPDLEARVRFTQALAARLAGDDAEAEDLVTVRLDRARAIALAAAPGTATDAVPGTVTAGPGPGWDHGQPATPEVASPFRPRPLGRPGRQRPGSGRGAQQVLGLAAALLVAVGAVALVRNAADDRDDEASTLEAAGPPTTAPPGAASGAGTVDQGVREAVTARAQAADQAEQRAGERAMGGDAAASAPSPPSAAPAPSAPTTGPDLGTFASIDDLVASLGAAPTTTSAASTGGAPPTPTNPTTAAPFASGAPPSPACAPAGATVLGTATVAGRPILVAELVEPTGGRQQRRLLGYDAACTTVFDQRR